MGSPRHCIRQGPVFQAFLAGNNEHAAVEMIVHALVCVSKHRASGHFSVERHTTDVRGGTLVTRDPVPFSGVVSEVSCSCGLLTEAAEVLPSALLVV